MIADCVSFSLTSKFALFLDIIGEHSPTWAPIGLETESRLLDVAYAAFHNLTLLLQPPFFGGLTLPQWGVFTCQVSSSFKPFYLPYPSPFLPDRTCCPGTWPTSARPSDLHWTFSFFHASPKLSWVHLLCTPITHSAHPVTHRSWSAFPAPQTVKFHESKECVVCSPLRSLYFTWSSSVNMGGINNWMTTQ